MVCGLRPSISYGSMRVKTISARVLRVVPQGVLITRLLRGFLYGLLQGSFRTSWLRLSGFGGLNRLGFGKSRSAK